MTNLESKHCVPCSGAAKAMEDREISMHLAKVPGWSVIEQEGVKRLSRSFAFPGFDEAMEFALKVGRLAGKEGHHPAILVEWGRATVSWWTHAIGGLHLNDFIMAAKTERL